MARSLLFAGLASCVAKSSSNLVLLAESDYGAIGGRCLDGSMAGYYYGAPSSGQSSIWVIWLDGGGLCFDKESCTARTEGEFRDLGSSKGWSLTYNRTINPHLPGSKILLDTPAENPDFHDAHHVHVPYCTGDLHTGQVEEPTADQWGFYFSGHLNFKNIMQDIMDSRPEVTSIERVLLTGDSAGGHGTFNNCDFLQNFLVEAGSRAQVSCAPCAGWFSPGFTEDHDDPLEPPSRWDDWSAGRATLPSRWKRITTVLWQMHHPMACTAALAMSGVAWKCASATAMYPYVRSPMYVVQNWFDTTQLHQQFFLPKQLDGTSEGQEFIAYFGRAIEKSTHLVVKHPSGKEGDGLFLASCFDHGSGIKYGDDTKLQGHTSFEGLADWFYDRGQISAILADDCQQLGPGLPCNPTCPGVPMSGGHNVGRQMSVIIVLVAFLLVALGFVFVCWLTRRERTKIADILAQSLQPIDARESSLQPRG